MIAVGALIFEIGQLATLPFLALQSGALDLALQDDVDDVGLDAWSGLFGSLSALAARLVLYLPQLSTATFWAFFGVAALWYLLFSLPVVVENMLEWHEPGLVSGSKLYGLLTRHLRTTLYLTIVVMLLKPLDCSYEAGERSVMLVDGDVACWDFDDDTRQPTMAVCGLVALAV